MPVFTHFCSLMGGHCLQMAGGNFPEQSFSQVRLLGTERTQAGCLYIAEPEALRQAANAGLLDPAALFAVCTQTPASLPVLQGQAFVVTNLPPLSVFALAQEQLARHWEWERTFTNTCYELHTHAAILKAAAGILQQPVYLLDSGHAVLHAAGTAYRTGHALQQELERNARLSAATLAQLSQTRWVQREEYVIFRGDGVTAMRFRSPAYEYLTLILFETGTEDVLQMLFLLRQSLLQLERVPLHAANPFLTFLTNLCTGVYTSREETVRQFCILGLPYQAERDFYHCITVERPGGFLDSAQLTRLLASQLHTELVTQYDGRMVFLLCSETDYYRPREIDLPALDTLLRRHGCRACIGDCDRISMLHGRYLLNLQAHKVDNVIGADAPHSYFFVDDYLSYMLLDLAASQFVYHQGANGSNGVGLLLDPRVRMLKAYDTLHETDLAHTLHQYLLHYNSLSQTAQALYVHKNTVLNQIHHICSMLDLNLDDPMTRVQLLHSFLLMDYALNIFGRPNVEIPDGGTVTKMK